MVASEDRSKKELMERLNHTCQPIEMSFIVKHYSMSLHGKRVTVVRQLQGRKNFPVNPHLTKYYILDLPMQVHNSSCFCALQYTTQCPHWPGWILEPHIATFAK